MKKKAVFVLLGLSTVMLLSGCGKSEKEQAKEYYQEELGLNEEEAQEIADFVYSDGSDPEEEKVQEEETAADKELERFPVSAEWKDYSVPDNMIQIDDTMYTAGVTVAEIMKKTEGSAAGYTYEYNPGKLVNKDKQESIEICRGGDPWFIITARNIFNETMSLEELPVSVIEIQKPALEYCYYIDGRSYEDIMSMKYSDVKALLETVFADEVLNDAARKEMKYLGRSEKSIEDEIQNHYNYSVKLDENDVPRIKNGLRVVYSTAGFINPEWSYIVPDDDTWKYSYMRVWANYEFYVDKDTTEMVEFAASIVASRTGFPKELVVE